MPRTRFGAQRVLELLEIMSNLKARLGQRRAGPNTTQELSLVSLSMDTIRHGFKLCNSLSRITRIDATEKTLAKYQF